MCEECGCGLPREVNINGTPGSQVPSPFTGAASGSGHVHTHEHVHAHEGGAAHSHPHEHSHEHESASEHGHAHDSLHSHDEPHSHPHDHPHDHEHPHEHPHAVLTLNQPVLDQNDRLAERNRGYFKAKKLLVLNVLSSPGAGKTTLLQKTIIHLGKRLRAGVIVGDLETDNDAKRLRAAGAPAVQITTGTVCHLDAEMVSKAMGQLDLDHMDLLVIENVGNLVCPASYDLGEDLRVVLHCVTEGEDKPLKYPPIFSNAHVVILSKMDLAGPVEFHRDEALANIRRLAPQARIFELSARTGVGMEEWCNFLIQKHQDAAK